VDFIINMPGFDFAIRTPAVLLVDPDRAQHMLPTVRAMPAAIGTAEQRSATFAGDRPVAGVVAQFDQRHRARGDLVGLFGALMCRSF
jgi:hypothetical protein